MHDGAIVFKTKIDNSDVQKDLDRVKRDIDKSQKAISEAETAKLPLVKQAEQLKAKLQEARQELAFFKDEQSAAQTAMQPGAALEDYMAAYEKLPELNAAVEEQQKKVDQLEKEWSQVNGKVEKYNQKISQAKDSLEAQKAKAAELSKQLSKGGVDMSGAMENAQKAAAKFQKRLSSIVSQVFVFTLISKALRGVTEYMGKALKSNKEFTSELAKLKGALLTAFQPIYELLIPALMALMQIATNVVTAVAKVAAMLGGKSVSQYAKNAKALYNEANAIEETGKAAKKAQRSLAGFDEINQLSNNPQGSDATTQDETAPDFSGVNEGLEKVRGTMEAILVLVGLVGAGILAWKILDAYTAGVNFSGVLKDIGTKALIAAGAVLLIKGYCDGWVNGIDWGNLLITLGGIAAILTGITIKFGTFGLSIGLVAAGIALVILGVTDFIKNGPTLQNTILIIGGAIAVAVGLATAGLSVVLSAIIAATAAVAAFTVAILLEEPAIMSTKEAQEALTAAKEKAAEAENSYISAVDGAENALKRLEDAEKAAGITGAELYEQVQNGTLDYANMTAEQKEVYKAYLDNEQKQKDLKIATEEFNAAKKAEILASYEHQLALAKESGNYDEFKKSVIDAFESGKLSATEARELIGKSMSEMSDDAQKTFMEDLPGDIKQGLDPSQYETTRKKMGDWFKGLGKGFMENIWEPVKKFWNDHIAQIFTGQFWSNLAKVCGNGLLTGFEWAINGLIWLFESLINLVVDGLNFFVGGVSKVTGAIGDLIGIDLRIPQIPKAYLGRVSIPRLAQGAVIPPNREFMAVLGDQRHGTNIEAPLDTIKQALAEVMATQGAGDVNITFTGDLAQLARVLKPVIDRENRRVGGSLIKGGAL